MATLLETNTGRVLSRNVRAARTPWARTIGFLFRDHIGDDELLWFDHCTAVHTLGMRVAIDIIFVDATGTVVEIVAHAARNRPLIAAKRACGIYEAASGFAAARGLRIGDRLQQVDRS